MDTQNALKTNFKIIISIFSLSLLLLSFKPSWAEDEINQFSNKIGPFLRKAITEIKVDSTKLLKQGEVEKKELIKVIVVMNYDHLTQLSEEIIDQLKDRVEQLGGYIGDHAFNNVQVWIPINNIEKLAEWSEIRLIKKPFKPQINSITSEGIDVIGANYWHNGGLTGEGVKIGVIDGGFKDYDSLLGTELPISVTTTIMGSYSDFISDNHGTACTEIVHDVAPDAELYLVNIVDSDVDFHNAVSWLRSQNVNVISSSIGLNLKIYCGLLYEALRTSTSDDYILYWIQYSENLKDQWDSTINSAINQGTTWTQAAGNDGQKKWIGLFNDSDGDFYLNFSSYENYNEIELPSYFSFGQEIYVTLFWGFDTDLITYDNYDLYITDEFGFTIDSSTTNQLQLPIGMEACKLTPIPGKKYYIWVLQYWAVPKEISLLIGVDDFPNLKYPAPAGTVKLFPPAHNPNVITVGAVPYSNPYNIEPCSSQGPNNDGVIKPDLVAPTRVSTESYGASSFYGTSAAAPHVAGACALVKQIYPDWSPSQIKDYLESNAIDLGTSGKDNTYGSGLVMLPTTPSVPLASPIGFMAATNLWIGAVIDTEEKGPVEAVWQKGGEGTTSRGDTVIWGYFYASPSDVTWGSQDNPDCFVKIWFDVSGRVDVNFFHVSVPDIVVYSDYPYDGVPDEQGTTTMSRRYIRQYYENGQSHSEENYEDGNPPSGYSPSGNPSGCSTINTLSIGSIINTVEKGPIDGIWHFGGQDTTARGDEVVWGHFYASPSDVTWGSQDNPDLFVKIWFDVSGRVDVNFFHVSVPDIEVYSALPDDGTYDQKGTTIMANRYIRHEYWDDFSSAAIIADHQAAANFSNIPLGYVSLARSSFNIYYGHTSHGSQVITGLSMLENENANYGSPCIHEIGPDLGYPVWESQTREYLNGHSETNLVMWSWCGQLSGYSAEEVNDYLTKMSRLEADYPNVTFIYMTGHLSGSGPSGTLYANNNQIRSFCRENSKILFDFADIESYDPDGNYYPDGGDACEWCSTWCNSHDCPSCDYYCAHSHCFNCYLKGKAFWWLLARLSGWN